MAVTALLFALASWLGGLIVYCAARDLLRGWRWHRNRQSQRRHRRD